MSTTVYRLAGELAELTLRAQVEHDWRGDFHILANGITFYDASGSSSQWKPHDAENFEATVRAWIETAKRACGIEVTK